MIHISKKLLFVDDQQEILDLLKQQLSEEYDCAFANTGAEGLYMLQSEGPIAVIIVDYGMPDMNGIDVLREVKTRSPDTVPLMLTAHNDLDIAVSALHEGNIFRFLSKPWDVGTLKKGIDDALEQYRVVVTERTLAMALADANRNLQKKVEQLEHLNQLLEYWVEFSPAVIYSMSLENDGYKPTYVSKNFSRLTGYERTEIIVDPEFWLTNVHPDDAESLRSNITEVITEGSDTHSAKYRFRHQDGEYRWIYDSFRVIRDQAGEALEIVGAWLDSNEQINH